MPGAQRPLLRGVGPDVVIWQDVEQGCALDPLGMVKAHARGSTGAAVMPGNEELAIPQLLHDLDLVPGHSAERVVDVAFAGVVGTDTVAIAAQIGRDDVEVFRQPAGDLVPGDVSEWISMQQQQWRSVAAIPEMDPRLARRNVGPRKPLEHASSLSTLKLYAHRSHRPCRHGQNQRP